MALDFMSLLGVGLQAGGQIYSGQSEQAAAKYRSKVARNNAIIAQRAADQAKERGRIVEGNIRTEGMQTIGAVRASAAARGVQVDTGSNLVSQQDITQLTELDALTARVNAEREAIRLRRQAAEFKAEERFEKKGGKSAFIGSLLSAGGTVASKWYDIFPKGE